MSDWDFYTGASNEKKSSLFDTGLNFSASDIKQAEGSSSALVPDVGLNMESGEGWSFGGLNLGGNASSPNWWQKMTGGTDKNGFRYNGWGGTALDLAKTGLGFYLGFNQLKQAEDTLDFQKDAFNKQYTAQKTLVNDQLQWQHDARENRRAGSGGTLTQIA